VGTKKDPGEDVIRSRNLVFHNFIWHLGSYAEAGHTRDIAPRSAVEPLRHPYYQSKMVPSTSVYASFEQTSLGAEPEIC
jgi:hypothetical protein